MVSEAWQDGTAESIPHLRWCPPWDEVGYAGKVESKHVQALCGGGQHVFFSGDGGCQNIAMGNRKPCVFNDSKT